MARVAVLGAGIGGLAAAARLAKLGHDVVVLERAEHAGGACTRLEQDGFSWDAGPATTLLPAVLRDLFRRSGRPLEAELELVAHDVVREHRFVDGSSVALPTGSRGEQLRAVDALTSGRRGRLGERWAAYVDSHAQTWELLRRDVLERAWSPEVGRAETRRLLDSRTSLHRAVRRDLPDPRLRLLATHPYDVDGHDLRGVPAWAGVVTHLEQKFGVWAPRGGMAALTDALVSRLALRGVELRLGVEASDLVVRRGRVAAVATAHGELAADVVVCAIDPRRLPALRDLVERTTPALPPYLTHLGLTGELPEMAHHEVVLHGVPLVVVRRGPPGSAPAGSEAWTVLARGRGSEDPVRALAERGVDVRGRVETRVDRSPRVLAEAWGGSPLGVAWEGRGTVRRRLGPTTPVAGVLACGAHAALGPGLPFVGMSAALVAAEVGPA